MRWLVKINRDSEGVITERKPRYMTNEKSMPRGGEFIFLDGPETEYPMVEFDETLSEYKVVEDSATKTLEDNIKVKEERMRFGQRLIAIISIRNDAKTLTPAQIGQLPGLYSTIRAALQDGSITTAEYLIGELEPDGTLLTEDDKTFALNEISNNKARLGYA